MSSHLLSAPILAAEFYTVGNDPTLLAWITTAVYLFAAGCCFITWRHLRAHSVDPEDGEALWLALGVLLLLLGVNKESDLHTLITEVGRDVANRLGIYEIRRGLQAAFFVLVCVTLAVTLWWQRKQLRLFARNHATAVVGIGTIGLYIAIRFAAIVHVGPRFIQAVHDPGKYGFLEIAGNALIAWSAIKRARADNVGRA